MLFNVLLFMTGITALPQLYPLSTRSSNLTMNSSISNHTKLPEWIPKRACGTGKPSAALVRAHQQLHSKRPLKRASPSTSLFTVDTVFHVVSTADRKNSVSKQMIANQLGALQAAFALSNISFHLLDVDYTVNDTWATDQNDADMKLALRKGNYSTLNIYFQTNLSTTAYGDPTQLLGYCTLPTNVTYFPCDSCSPAEFPTQI